MSYKGKHRPDSSHAEYYYVPDIENANRPDFSGLDIENGPSPAEFARWLGSYTIPEEVARSMREYAANWKPPESD